MTRQYRWGPLWGLLALCLAGAAAAVSSGVWRDVAKVATEREEQSHILLAIPVAAWLAWLRRERLRYAPPNPSFLGCLLIAAGGASAWFGFRNGTEVLWHGGALLMVWGALLSVLGPGAMRAFLPAVLALAFLIPIPGRVRHAIALPLQEISAQAAEVLLDLFGFPVGRFGNVLAINDHQVAVAEACNGMRMVAALALVSFAFVFSTPMRNSVRLFILAVSPAVALLVNVVRLVPTALMFGYADPASAELFHSIGGWAVLALALLVLWCILGVMRWLEIPLTPYPAHE